MLRWCTRSPTRTPHECLQCIGQHPGWEHTTHRHGLGSGACKCEGGKTRTALKCDEAVSRRDLPKKEILAAAAKGAYPLPTPTLVLRQTIARLARPGRRRAPRRFTSRAVTGATRNWLRLTPWLSATWRLSVHLPPARQHRHDLTLRLTYRSRHASGYAVLLAPTTLSCCGRRMALG